MSSGAVHTVATGSGTLTITDHGHFRRIETNGPAAFHGVMRARVDPVETPLTVATLERLVAFRGEWWLDEMARRDDPSYVSDRLLSLIGRFGTISGASVLDVGAGCGSSGLVMAAVGARRIVGVEPDPRAIELAHLRARDEGVSDRVVFHHLEDCSRIPAADEEFDLVIFNAVIEHIAPRLRHGVLRDAFRCLRPGGLMLFVETPNRWFPFDHHTTKLPLVTWLPLSLGYPVARRFSRHVSRGSSLDHFLVQGLAACSFQELRQRLPGMKCLNLHGGDAAWKCDLRRSPDRTRTLLTRAERALNRMGLPLCVLFPSLDLVFRKAERSGAGVPEMP